MAVKSVVVDGHTVRSEHRLADYMPPLAVALRRIVGEPDAEHVVFLHALAADCRKRRDPAFPPELDRSACVMRVQRLLAGPVEVDGIVMTLRVIERRQLRQMTRQLVARRGRLEDVLPAATGASASTSGGAVPALPPDVASRLGAIEERLDALEVLCGPAPPVLVTAEDLRRINHNTFKAHTDVFRLVKALRGGDLGAFEPYPEFVPIGATTEGDDES